jgi:hypothetical protein
MCAEKNAYRILVRRPERKRPLGRLRGRWVGNVNIDVKEMGRCGMDWIELGPDWDRCRSLQNMVQNIWVL